MSRTLASGLRDRISARPVVWSLLLLLLLGCSDDEPSHGAMDTGDIDDSAADMGDGWDAILDVGSDADIRTDGTDRFDANDLADVGDIGPDPDFIDEPLPTCLSEPNFAWDDFRLDIRLDLTEWTEGRYPVWERMTVRAVESGEAVSFFGEQFELVGADVEYAYDGHVATFCTDPFEVDEDVTVEVEFVVDEHFTMVPGIAEWGLTDWRSRRGDVVIGPMNEPYFAPYWLFGPQSLFEVDQEHDDNPALEEVHLTIETPDESWVVMGPGGPGTQAGTTWEFQLDVPMPLYALSFAASPSYQVFSVGTSASGVEVVGAVTPTVRSGAEIAFLSAVTTIDFMEEHVGPYEWGGFLSLVDVPRFGGGMEHTTVIWFGSDTLTPDVDGYHIVIHETVHHWLGDSIRFADWSDIWLVESSTEWMTNFVLLEEYLSAEDFTARKHHYRVYGAELTYPSASWMPAPGPLHFAQGEDVMEHFVSDLQLIYIYGASFFEMVNQRLNRDFGTDLVDTFHAWYQEMRLESATTDEFLQFLGDYTEDGDYWPPLFEDWVEKTPCPTIEFGNYDYSEGVVELTLTRVAGADQDIQDLQVVFVAPDQQWTTTVDIPADEIEVLVTQELPAAPSRIVVDPDLFYLLRLQTEYGWSGPGVSFLFE